MNTIPHAWNIVENILGVLFRPQIAPNIAILTGQTLKAVNAALLELERDGKVRKAGAKARWDGDLYDAWERVL